MIPYAGQGVQDRWRRTIRYLRVSLTDRCNFSCQYCTPLTGTPHAARREQLSVPEYLRIFRLFQQLGVRHIRLSGGEPLIYPELQELLESLPALAVPAWSISTNGILLPRWLDRLQAAGIQKINISVDSLDPVRFAELTRGGKLEQLLRVVDATLQAGFAQLAINVVLFDAKTLEEAPEMAMYFLPRGAQLRFIETMPLGEAGMQAMQTQRITAAQVRNKLESAFGPLKEESRVENHGPAEYGRLPALSGQVGFIAPWSAHFCET